MPKQTLKKQAGQSVEEMTLQLQDTTDSRLYGNRKGSYKEISDELKREALTAAIDQQAELLQRVRERGRVNLDSLEEVTATADAYMQSCKLAGAFPSMLGFAAACGYSRKHLYYYLEHNNNETSRYIDALRSSWAAILAQMGLTRQASEPVCIFLLKNSGQALTDRTELDINAQQSSPLGDNRTPAELEAEYAQMVESVVVDD